MCRRHFSISDGLRFIAFGREVAALEINEEEVSESRHSRSAVRLRLWNNLGHLRLEHTVKRSQGVRRGQPNSITCAHCTKIEDPATKQNVGH